MPFPKLGLIESTAKREQPEGSCLDVQNMRAFSPFTGRSRGAQRMGLRKWSTAQIAGASGRIQCLNHVVTVQASTESQSQMQIRTVTPIAVNAGKIRTFSTTASLTPTGVSDPDLLADAPFIMSATFGQKVYFCDGTNYIKYDPATGSNGTVSAWTAATAGTIPANGSDVCRLIVSWNNRIVMSGIKSDSQNVFMSAWGDAEDFNYNPIPSLTTQAVAFGTTEDMSKMPGPVMCLIPYNNDILLIGLDHEIYSMTGDPMLGGQIDRVSDVTGISFGSPWCKSPEGILYFFGSRGGVYRLTPESQPERITSVRFERRLAAINLDTHYVTMIWDDEEIAVKVFVTSLAGYVTENYVYDVRNDAWFLDVYDNLDHNPVAVHVFDGDDPNDRVMWMGGQDGYIRCPSEAHLNDDGTAINSYVVLGPIQAGDAPFVLAELQAVLEKGTHDVTWEVAVGDSAENIQFNSGGYVLQENGGRILLEDGLGHWISEGESNNVTGTFSPVRSYTANPRRRGYAAYVKLSNSTLDESWEMENLRARLSVVNSSKGRR